MGCKGLKLRWAHPALTDLIEAQYYIAQQNLSAAQAVAQRVWEASKTLTDNPHVGRVGHVRGTREWVVTGTPYLIVYRVHERYRGNPAFVAHQARLAIGGRLIIRRYVGATTRMHNPPHPAEVFRRLYLAPSGVSVTEGAKRLGITRKTLSQLN